MPHLPSAILSPVRRIIVGMQPDSVMFSATVRAAAREARRLGLVVPVFRSPPALPGVDRTIARRAGQVVVAVRLRGRPMSDIAADVIEGILAAGETRGVDALDARRRLLCAVEAAVAPCTEDRGSPATGRPPSDTVRRQPGWRNRKAQGA